jgi:hypothetical protein
MIECDWGERLGGVFWLIVAYAPSILPDCRCGSKRQQRRVNPNKRRHKS